MKIGIFGGAFDPLHVRHVRICEKVLTEYSLDKLIVVPSYNPPHKKLTFDNYFDRIKMLNTALRFDERIEISAIEYNDKGRNYSYETVKKISEGYPEADLYFIIGGDSLEWFLTWKNPEIITATATLIVIRRPGIDTNSGVKRIKEKLNARVLVSDLEEEDISSAYIRAVAAIGGDISAFIPKEILGIAENLYKKSVYDDYIRFVKSVTSEALFEHIKQTVLRAVKDNERFGLDGNSVFLSALLHDVAKEIKFTTKRQDGLNTVLTADNDWFRKIKKYEDISEYYEKLVNSEYAVPVSAVGTPVLHQFTGARTAEIVLGISDKGILDAICYHTTAKPKMSDLEMLTYLADKIEANRFYDGVDEIRELIKTSLSEAFKLCFKISYNFVLSKKTAIYRLTEEAYLFYFS
ncbi:MAG: nicotinate (nicotinamide) nucleotide adenylyltransferase [Clostridiales bacterium]|jgi:nicotinate-nucleotide adenylyltransferase|nr:nicotinate (nicotinamide) nucleotide adenylyltransferase [Clostridiales bacterium]